MTDPSDVRRVHAVLAAYGISVLVLPEDTSTAERAAQALHTDVAKIVKSLVFMAREAPMLVLAAGNRRVSHKAVERFTRVSGLHLATPAEVLRVTGFEVGGVPPVGHRISLPTIVDQSLLAHPVVYAAAGDPHSVFEVTPQLLVLMTEGRTGDIG